MTKYGDGLVKGIGNILADDVLKDLVAKAMAEGIRRHVNEYVATLMDDSTVQMMIENRVKEILAEEEK